MAQQTRRTDVPRPPTTPSFVVDVPTLDLLVDTFRRALDAHWPGSILSYSVKSNSLPWLLAYFRSRGVMAEVVSDTEYELSLAVGHRPDGIVANGQALSRDRLRSALRGGSIVNLDAEREVRWAAELAWERPDLDLGVGLRVNWDLDARVPGESTGGEEGSRFGFNVENGALDRAIADLTEAGVRVAGLHMHRNSRTQAVAVYRAAAALAAELVTSRGLDLDWIDIGGGFFGNDTGSPSFDDYVRAIREGVGSAIDTTRTRLIVEPGGSLVAIPVEFHSTVLHSKTIGPHTFVVTDGSNDHINPLGRRLRPFDYSLETASTDAAPHQVITSFTFVEEDRIMRLTDAPALAPGDRVTYYRVGGYTMCLQPLFIEFLPAVYVRDADGVLTQVRQQWGAAEYLQGNQWTAGGGVERTRARAPERVSAGEAALT